VEQDLLTLPEHLSSPTVFSGVRVTRFLVLCVCFVDRCVYFFDIRILIAPLVSSIFFKSITRQLIETTFYSVLIVYTFYLLIRVLLSKQTVSSIRVSLKEKFNVDGGIH